MPGGSRPLHELVHEFAPLTAPLARATARAVPPDGLRPRGDKHVEDPETRPAMIPQGSSAGGCRGARAPCTIKLVHEFAPHRPPRPSHRLGRSPQRPPAEGGQTGGSRPLHDQAGPRVRSAHRPPRPSHRPGCSAPPEGLRPRGDKHVEDPEARPAMIPKGSSAGGCRGARAPCTIKLVHEFAPLTAPLARATGSGGPPRRPPGPRGDKHVEDPEARPAMIPKGSSAGGCRGARAPCTIKLVHEFAPLTAPLARATGSGGPPRRPPAEGGQTRGRPRDATCDDPERIERWGVPGGSRPLHDQISRRSAAQRVSSLRLERWSLRSTFETWVSTVFTEM
jgi:hypothetical protein